MPSHKAPAIDRRHSQLHPDPVARCLSRLKENPDRRLILFRGSPLETVIGYVTKGDILPAIENDDTDYESTRSGFYVQKYHTCGTGNGATTKRPVWLFLGDEFNAHDEIRRQIDRGTTETARHEMTESLRFASLHPRAR